jgi:hypothetical protein
MPHTHRHPALPLSGLNLRHSPSAQRPHATQHSAPPPAAAFCTRSIRPRVCAHPALTCLTRAPPRARSAGRLYCTVFLVCFCSQGENTVFFVFLNPNFVVLPPRTGGGGRILENPRRCVSPPSDATAAPVCVSCGSGWSVPCVSEITHRHTFTFTQALHTPRRVPHRGPCVSIQLTLLSLSRIDRVEAFLRLS